jgi:hypothetical protein
VLLRGEAMSEKPMSAEDRAFYAGFVDIMTDDQRRRNRDSGVRMMLNELTGPFGGALGQESRIKERTSEDERIAAVLRQIKALLDAVATPELPVSRRRRKR